MTNTHMSISAYGVKVTAAWAGHIDKVVVDIRGGDSGIHWQQSIEDATALRDQLTAAIEASKGGAK